jgi:PKD repeat protein
VTSGDHTVDIGGAAAGRIALSANPSNVSAQGGTSTITAIVFDVDGNRLPGVPVSFTADAGAFSSTVSITNGAGEATTTITTNRETTVTASAGGSGGGTGGSGGENGGGAAAAVTATVKITVSPLPTVKITATVPTGGLIPGVPVTFAVEAAATAPAAIRTVTVDFGDGTIQTFGNTTSVAHTYRTAGAYTVSVTAEDTNGGRATGSTTIVVQASEIAVELRVTPNPVPAPGVLVSFNAAVTQNPGSIPIQSVTFDFGDGNVRTLDGPLTQHLYGSSGNFTATATVRLVNGQTGVGSTAVRVN